MPTRRTPAQPAQVDVARVVDEVRRHARRPRATSTRRRELEEFAEPTDQHQVGLAGDAARRPAAGSWWRSRCRRCAGRSSAGNRSRSTAADLARPRRRRAWSAWRRRPAADRRRAPSRPRSGSATTTTWPGASPPRALDLLVVAVPDQEDRVAAGGVAAYLGVHLRHQRAGGVDDRQVARPRPRSGPAGRRRGRRAPVTLPSGTSATSSTKTAPRCSSSRTTWLLCTIWRRT